MMFTGIGLGILLIVLLGLLLKTKQALRYWPTHYDAQYRVTTRDGWTLDLYRYKDLQCNQIRGVILLCHDIGCTPQAWEEGGPLSWPLQLKSLGYDVWSVGLRGTASSRPRFLDLKHGWGWNLDVHLQDDLPAVFTTIQSHSPHHAIHWVGHGMGGVLGLLANTYLKQPLQSVAILHTGLSPIRRLHVYLAFLHFWPLPYVPFSQTFRWLLPLLHLGKQIRSQTQRIWKRSSLRTEPTPEFMLFKYLVPVSLSLLQQWLGWLGQGKWWLGQTKESLHTKLQDVSCPVLCVVGPGDSWCPERAARRLLEQLPPSLRSFYFIKDTGDIAQQMPQAPTEPPPRNTVSPKQRRKNTKKSGSTHPQDTTNRAAQSTPKPSRSGIQGSTGSEPETALSGANISQDSSHVASETTKESRWLESGKIGLGHYAPLFHPETRQHLITLIHRWMSSYP